MRGFCGILNGFPGFINIAFRSARQPGNDRDFSIGFSCWGIAHFLRDPADSFQVIRRSGRESGFDDVHAQARQVVSHFQFFGGGHRRTGDCSPSRKVVSKIRT